MARTIVLPERRISRHCRFAANLMLLGIAIVWLAIAAQPALASPVGDAISEARRLIDKGRYEQARNTLLSARDEATRARERKRLAGVLEQGGMGLYAAGQYVLAAAYFLDAVAMQQQTGDWEGIGRSLNNAGRLQRLSGDFAAASTSFERALMIAKDNQDTDLEAQTLTNLATLDLSLRNYAPAIARLEDALRLTDNELVQIEARMVAGAVYRQQGDFERALEYYKDAKELSERRSRLAGYRPMAARILGELYIHRVEGGEQENFKQARLNLEAARQGHESAGDRLGFAMARSHLGELAYKQDRYDTALAEYDAALRVFEDAHYIDGIGRMHLHRGFALGDTGKPAEAVASFDRAIELYQRLDDPEWQRVALYGKGLNLERLDRLDEAEASYKQAVDTFESIRVGVAGGPEAQALFSRVNSELYQQLVGLLVARGDFEGALEYVERSRLESLREALLTPGLEGDGTRGGDGQLSALVETRARMGALQQQRRETRDPATLEQLSRELANTEHEANKVVFNLKRRHPGIEHTFNLVPDTRGFRRSAEYPEGLALVTYFLQDQSLLIFVIEKNSSVAIRQVDVSASEIREKLLDAIVLLIDDGKRARKEGWTGQLANRESERLQRVLVDLHGILIGPLDDLINDADTLAILPSAWLNFLPFEALIAPGEEGRTRYLVEEMNIVYLSSHTNAGDVWTLSGAKESPEPSIVAFGNPEGGKRNLPNADAEIAFIKQLFPSAKMYNRSEATKEKFRQEWGRYDILHVAAHAELRDDRAEILLAPPEAGRFAMEEIFDLPPNDRTRFVVLSACKTALDPDLTEKTWEGGSGKQSPARGGGGPLSSFAHTLIFAGIPSVIGTLWDVDDEGSALLMKEFYENLKNGNNFYGSLRQARLAMIEREDAFSHPYFWASFAFYGADR
jgi:CHAT domain-containing protein